VVEDVMEEIHMEHGNISKPMVSFHKNANHILSHPATTILLANMNHVARSSQLLNARKLVKFQVSITKPICTLVN